VQLVERILQLTHGAEHVNVTQLRVLLSAKPVEHGHLLMLVYMNRCDVLSQLVQLVEMFKQVRQV